jgi:hypothetical protein
MTGGQGPSKEGRHRHRPRGPRVEQVGHARTGDLEGEGQKGGIRLGGSLAASALWDVTPRLRLVGCSLRVVGHLLRDVGRIPGDVEQVRQEVGLIFFAVSLSLPSLAFFPTEEREENCCCN